MEGFLVAKIDASAVDRRKAFACTYCGNTTGKTRDHIVSVAWSGFGRCYDVGEIVDCCSECNSLLSDKPLFSIESRSFFLAQALQKKYKKVLKIPKWGEDELNELDRSLKVPIAGYVNIKSFVQARISHCYLMSLETSKWERDEIDSDPKKVGEILKELKRGYSLRVCCDNLGFSYSKIKALLGRKAHVAQVNSFKFENGVPFQADIITYFEFF